MLILTRKNKLQGCIYGVRTGKWNIYKLSIVIQCLSTNNSNDPWKMAWSFNQIYLYPLHSRKLCAKFGN